MRKKIQLVLHMIIIVLTTVFVLIILTVKNHGISPELSFGTFVLVYTYFIFTPVSIRDIFKDEGE